MRARRVLLWMTAGTFAALVGVGASSAPRTDAQLIFPPPSTTIAVFPPTTGRRPPAPPITPLPTVQSPYDTTPFTEVPTSLARPLPTTTTAPTTTTTLGTIPPPPGAGTGPPDTAPPDRAPAGQGKMPAWPLWIFGIGAGGTAAILIGQYVRTRPGRGALGV
jgi:hypothetical protein